MPDADFGSDAGCDVPTIEIEGDRNTWTGATDSETGLSADGAAGSVAWAFAMKQSEPAVAAVASKLLQTLRARWFIRALPL